jgi:hypothetical protein
MAFNSKDIVFIQRDDANTLYRQVNISASNAVFYVDADGHLSASKVATFPHTWPSSSNSITSSYAFTSSYALNALGGSSDTSLSASWASSSISSSYAELASSSSTSETAINSLAADFALLAGEAIHTISSSYTVSASWAPMPPAATTSNSSSWASSSLYSIVAEYATSSLSSSWASSSLYSIQSGFATSSLSSSWASSSFYSIQSGFATSSLSSSWASSSLSASRATTTNSSSYSLTASFAHNAFSSSWARTASYFEYIYYNVTQSTTILANWASASLSSSFASSSLYAYIAGYATTSLSASWASSSLYSIQSGYATSSLSASFATVAYRAIESAYATSSLSSSFSSVSNRAIESTYATSSLSSSFASSSFLSSRASFATSSLSSSFASSSFLSSRASFATSSLSASFASSSFLSSRASFATSSLSASYSSASLSASYAVTASYAHNSFNSVTASYALITSGGFSMTSGSTWNITSSWALNALTASYVLLAVSSSYSLTSSYALNTPASFTIASGSSWNITSSWSTSSLTASSINFTPQLASTASYVLLAISSSYSRTSSFALNIPAPFTIASGSLWNITSSWSSNTVSASYAPGSPSISSSYALTSSYTFTSSYAAAAPVVFTSKTDNYLPKWSSNSLTATSSIYDNGTSVGIGTNNPLRTVELWTSASSPILSLWEYSARNDGSDYGAVSFNGSTINLGTDPTAEIRFTRVGAGAHGSLSFRTRGGGSSLSRETLLIDNNQISTFSGSVVGLSGFTGSILGTSSYSNNGNSSSYSRTSSYANVSSDVIFGSGISGMVPFYSQNRLSSTSSLFFEPAGAMYLRSSSFTIQQESSSVIYIQSLGPSDYDAPNLEFDRARGKFTSRSPVIDGDYLGQIVFKGYKSGYNGYYPSNFIRSVAAESYGVLSGSAASLQFFTTTVGSVSPEEAFRITPSGSLMFAPGKIIHSSTPFALQLFGSSSFATTASFANASTSASYSRSGSYSITASYAATAAFAPSSSFANTASYFGSGTNNYVPKWTNNALTSTSRIYDDGSMVGIGTVPTSFSTLQVSGRNPRETPSINAVFSVSDTDDVTKVLVLGYSSSFGDGTNGAGIIAAADQTLGWRPIVINPHGGNVGINVTNPRTSLHVQGTISSSAITSSSTWYCLVVI